VDIEGDQQVSTSLPTIPAQASRDGRLWQHWCVQSGTRTRRSRRTWSACGLDVSVEAVPGTCCLRATASGALTAPRSGRAPKAGTRFSAFLPRSRRSRARGGASRVSTIYAEAHARLLALKNKGELRRNRWLFKAAKARPLCRRHRGAGAAHAGRRCRSSKISCRANSAKHG